MKKQILGNVYFDDDETYHNVYVECPKDEAPQIYLTFPVKALRLCQLRVCVWVNDPDLLIRIGEELKERISKLQTERQQQHDSSRCRGKRRAKRHTSADFWERLPSFPSRTTALLRTSSVLAEGFPPPRRV